MSRSGRMVRRGPRGYSPEATPALEMSLSLPRNYGANSLLHCSSWNIADWKRASSTGEQVHGSETAKCPSQARVGTGNDNVQGHLDQRLHSCEPTCCPASYHGSCCPTRPQTPSPSSQVVCSLITARSGPVESPEPLLSLDGGTCPGSGASARATSSGGGTVKRKRATHVPVALRDGADGDGAGQRRKQHNPW